MAETMSYRDDARLGSVQRYMTGSETIRLTVYNAASGVTVTISGRRFDQDARISEFAHRLTPTTNRVATTLDITPGDGWLLGLAVRVTAGAPLDGQTYAVVEVGAGAAGAFTAFDVLCAGTISAAKRLAWPGSPLAGPLDGAGALRSISGSVPAAGAEISETVPTGAQWELISFLALLTTSATVATRLPLLRIDDGTNMLTEQPPVIGLAASLALRYGWGQGVQNFTLASNGTPHSPLPIGVRLAAGFRIRTSTVNIQAADQWSAVQYLVRERIEGA